MRTKDRFFESSCATRFFTTLGGSHGNRFGHGNRSRYQGRRFVTPTLSFIICHMTRVISSPSISTTGPSTLIFFSWWHTVVKSEVETGHFTHVKFHSQTVKNKTTYVSFEDNVSVRLLLGAKLVERQREKIGEPPPSRCPVRRDSCNGTSNPGPSS